MKSKRSGSFVRWAGLIALIAICGTFSSASATGAPMLSTVTTIQPCRLMDTRSGLENVGPRNRPLGQSETYSIRAAGVTQGNCSLPGDANGLVMNVTVVNPTGGSFLTVWPTNLSRPLSSNLNWVSGQGPTPNQVTSALSPSGSISIFNNTGTVDVIVDITGYITAHDANSVFYTKTEIDALVAANSGTRGAPGADGAPGQTGPPGSAGSPGAPGNAGVNGVSGFEVVASTGSFTWAQINASDGGLHLRGASCPSGKVLINQGITWAAFSDIYSWHNTFPSVLATDIDTVTQTPVFWISASLNLSGERWDYTAKSYCVLAS